ncbi:CobW family GTP-binding protein [Rhodococcus tukisamuensis]|uniref:Cobalamin biosynthesis protein CobW n=1 Tax=Rhodococcus tukisamuensis TaxID=168276 RepID=A0A1G6XN60_9NOCA|nr:GTP-binding protein [Rhodococcus tukisamuensis]SDD78777.1 cobalamin biosynthesis protein CobW [Rhodococcus tukisamuensis]
MAKRLIPVILVAGFLGSGKTTLLNHLLRNNRGVRIGVVVNDFGSVNIDSMMVAGQVDSMVSLSNGCLCCAVDVSEMDEMLDRLAHPRSDIDVIVVEASGLAEPRNMVRLVLGSENPHIGYGGLVVTVDAAEFEDSRARHPELDLHVRMADLVVLNKIDRIAEAERDRAVAVVAELNDRAPVLCTEHGRVDPRLLFDEAARADDGPRQLSLDELLTETDGHDHACGDAACGDHSHLHDGYDSVSFVGERPMDPRALIAFLENRPPGLYRVKGFVHFAVAGHRQKYLLQAVGPHIRFERTGWARGEPRTTTLVLIGWGIDPDAVAHRLEECTAVQEHESGAEAMTGVHRYVVSN